MLRKSFNLLVSVSTLSFIIPSSVFAQDTINLANTSSQYNRIYGLTPSRYITAAINLLLGVAGVAGFLYLLWGGLQLITAGGDKDAVQKGTRKIMFALIGLAVVFSAYALMYIVQVLFGVNLINFTITNI